MKKECVVCKTVFDAKTSGKCCSEDCKKQNMKFYQRRHYLKNPDKYLLGSVQSRCKKNNIPCNIDESDLVIPEFCPALGIPLYRNVGGNRPTDNSPSVDRIIPCLGYIKGNVQVISQKANSMKTNATPKELVLFAEWIIENLKND